MESSTRNYSLKWPILLAFLFLNGCLTVNPPEATPTESPTKIQTKSPTPAHTGTATITPTSSFTPTRELVSTGTKVPTGVQPISSDSVAGLSLLAQWGDGKPIQIAYSPDGKELGLTTSIGIYLYDANTLEQRLFIPSDVFIHGIAFSPDGNLLATGTEDGTLQLWDRPEMTLKWAMHIGDFYPDSIAFSPDGNSVVIGSSTGSYSNPRFLMINVNNRSVVHTFPGESSDVAAAFTPDGKRLITAYDEGIIDIWNVAAGNKVATLYGERSLNDIAISPDGSLLAATANGVIFLWDLTSYQIIQTLYATLGMGFVASLRFSPDGGYLAAGTVERNIMLWDTSDWTFAVKLEGHYLSVTDIDISPDGKTLSSISYDNTLRQWSLESFEQLRIADGYSSVLYGLVFSTDGAMVASASNDFMIKVRRFLDGAIQNKIQNWSGFSGRLFIAYSGLLAAHTMMGDLNLWNWNTGELVKTILLKDDGRIFDFVDAEKAFVIPNYQRRPQVELMDISSGIVMEKYPVKKGYITAAAVSPDKKILALGTGDEIYVYSVSDAALLYELEDEHAQSLAFSPDGEYLVTSEMHIIRVNDGYIAHAGDSHPEMFFEISFSPDGTIFATAEGDQLWIWSCPDGKLLKTLIIKTGCYKFSPDGRYLAIGSSNGLIQIWGIPN